MAHRNKGARKKVNACGRTFQSLIPSAAAKRVAAAAMRGLPEMRQARARVSPYAVVTVRLWTKTTSAGPPRV
jgi:hypothetical protein